MSQPIADKLRALDEVRRKDPKQMIYNEPLAAAIKVYDVLPELIRVVEAGENSYPAIEKFTTMRQALDDLDEALGDVQ